MVHLIHIFQYVSFVFSQFTNAILLYLIYKKTKKCFGPYRYMMAVFSVYALIYNYVDLMTQPLVLVEKQMFVVVNHGPLRYWPNAGYVLVCIFGASFGMCIYLLSAQFFYRYLALCKPNLLVHFEGAKLCMLFIPPLTLSITWFFFCLLGLQISPEKRKILEAPLHDQYDEDSQNVTFVGGLYWNADQKGVIHWNIQDCIGTSGLCVLMSLCCMTILFCGVNTYKKMNEAGDTLSDRTKDLNRQLFITLSLQTLLPFVLMYIPVGLLFALPLFETSIGGIASFSASSTAIYPAIEPLIAMFCISTFRKSILCCFKDGKVSSTAATSTNNF